jgi:hypothetical protein
LRVGVAWGGYKNASLINEKDADMLAALDGKNTTEMVALFDESPKAYVGLLLRTLYTVNKEEAIRYLLAAMSSLFKGTSWLRLHLLMTLIASRSLLVVR